MSLNARHFNIQTSRVLLLRSSHLADHVVKIDFLNRARRATRGGRSGMQRREAARGCRRCSADRCFGRRFISRSKAHAVQGQNPSRLRPFPNARNAMAASTSGGGPLSAQAAAALGEGIGLVFGRWTALQMAVENQWGGRDSRAKADQLAASILSWFSHPKGPHYIEDLEDMMYDTMSESFNADFEDGSVEEVAEQLMIMHEECLQSNYSSIEKLRNSHVQGNAVSQSRQMVVDDNDDSSDDDGDEPSMVGDDTARPEQMAVDEPKPSKPVPDADGWTVVPPRRGRGKN